MSANNYNDGSWENIRGTDIEDADLYEQITGLKAGDASSTTHFKKGSNEYNQYQEYLKQLENKKTSDKQTAERATGDIASTAANTTVRSSENSLRASGVSKGQAALQGQNAEAVNYQNNYQNQAGISSANYMDQLRAQLEGQATKQQMGMELENEEAAQKSQLLSGGLQTVADTATGFMTGGWAGAAAGLLSDANMKEAPDGIDDKELESAVNEFFRLKKEVEALRRK